MGQGGNGLLPFDMPTNPVDANRNAVLGYLAGALQGGNLGQSIGRGLQGWLSGAQTDATEQARHAAAQICRAAARHRFRHAVRADAKPGARNAVSAGKVEAAHDPRHRRVRIRQAAGLRRQLRGFYPAQAPRRASGRIIER
jgi:hypothetical protein